VNVTAAARNVMPPATPVNPSPSGSSDDPNSPRTTSMIVMTKIAPTYWIAGQVSIWKN
jgi:hypothetical protein